MAWQIRFFRKRNMSILLDTRHTYDSYGAYGSVPNGGNCRLRIFHHNEKNIVILTVDEQAKGTSITNLAEVLASQHGLPHSN